MKWIEKIKLIWQIYNAVSKYKNQNGLIALVGYGRLSNREQKEFYRAVFESSPTWKLFLIKKLVNEHISEKLKEEGA